MRFHRGGRVKPEGHIEREREWLSLRDEKPSSFARRIAEGGCLHMSILQTKALLRERDVSPGGSTIDVTRTIMKKSRATLIVAVFVAAFIYASSAQDSKGAAPNQAKPPSAPSAAQPGRGYSGMYSFLKEGEFVQITVEDGGRVNGFVSRYGDGESDKGAFLDQYFRSGKLDGNKIVFTTETVHAVWFEFKGTVERGEGKNPGDEAYYLLKGTLIENVSDGAKKVTTHSQEVMFKRFPVEASSAKD